MAKQTTWTEDDYKRILADLKQGSFRCVYLLHGKEAFYTQRLTEYFIESVIPKEQADFNLMVLFGDQVKEDRIADSARRFPMMADRQVIVVKEAQNLETPELLIPYIKNPSHTTILVLAYSGTVDKRTAFYKAFGKDTEVFESNPIEETQIPAWSTLYLSEHNCRIAPDAANLLAFYLGADLGKVANELDKLRILLPAGTDEITAKHIQDHVGINKDYNLFELTNAILDKDEEKANRIVMYYDRNTKNKELAFLRVVSTLFASYQRLLLYFVLKRESQGKQPNPQRVAQVLKAAPGIAYRLDQQLRRHNAVSIQTAFSILREFDLKMKGFDNGSADEGELMKEMVYKLIH
jgi:DNA polymerase-3 subunit delta